MFEPSCSAAVTCVLFLQHGLHDGLVKILPYAVFSDSSAARIHASFVLIFIVCTTPTILLHNFAVHSKSD